MGGIKHAYWLLAALMAGQFAVALTLDPSLAVRLIYFDIDRFQVQLLLFPLLIWFGALSLMVVKRRCEHPTRVIFRVTRQQRYYLLLGLLLTFATKSFAMSFGVIKTSIPSFVPFYADPYFIATDRLIFGTDPWRITHYFLGPAATGFIDRAYMAWFVMLFAMIGWMNFTRDRKLQAKGLLTIFLSWALLGQVSAITLSSVGPCFYAEFYGDGLFDPLMARLQTINGEYGLRALQIMDRLRQAEPGQIGAGISAMPSMHVAMSFLFLLLCREGLRRRWPCYVAAAFYTIIFVGSVHLGWHYAMDGVVATLGVYAIWQAVNWLVDGRRATASRAVLSEPQISE